MALVKCHWIYCTVYYSECNNPNKLFPGLQQAAGWLVRMPKRLSSSIIMQLFDLKYLSLIKNTVILSQNVDQFDH